MNKEDIIIFGTSKVAEIIYGSMIDDKNSQWNPIAFCVDRDYFEQDEKNGLPVYKFEEIQNKYPASKYKMLIAMGYHNMNRVRAEKCQQAKMKGYQLISYIHSKVEIPSSSVIGENTIILADVSIGPYTCIGNNVCIYSNATVAHHTTVEDNNWITSGTVIGGNTTIGNNCFLGIGCAIGHNIHIGNHNFIGTKAVVTKSTEDDAVFIVPDTPKYRLNTDQFMRMFKFD